MAAALPSTSPSPSGPNDPHLASAAGAFGRVGSATSTAAAASININTRSRWTVSPLPTISQTDGSDSDPSMAYSPSAHVHHFKPGGHVFIPSRSASRQKVSVDDLLNAGAAAISAPRFDMVEALRKWSDAVTITDREGDLFRKAKAQSNIGCALRNAGNAELALEYLEGSWASTMAYVRSAARRSPSNWLDIAIRALDLDVDDGQADSDHAGANPSSVSSAPATVHRNASGRSTRSDSAGPSTDSGADGASTYTNGADAEQQRQHLEASSRHVPGTGSPISHGHAESPSPVPTAHSNEPSQGPPIVIWLMQLTTNLGNAYYADGEYEHAIQQHENCKRIVEGVLEEYPLPVSLITAITTAAVPDSAATAFAAANPASPLSPFQSSTRPGSVPGINKQYRLSFLHRQALLAQARSLTHLGACFGALGLTAASLQHHMAAHTLLSTVSSIIHYVHPSSNVPRARSTSMSQPHTNLAEVRTLQAAVVANVGSAWHASGEVGKAVEWHERSMTLFTSQSSAQQPHLHRRSSSKEFPAARLTFRHDPCRRSLKAQLQQPHHTHHTCSIDEARQNANLGTLYLDVARHVDAVDWIGRVCSDAAVTDSAGPVSRAASTASTASAGTTVPTKSSAESASSSSLSGHLAQFLRTSLGVLAPQSGSSTAGYQSTCSEPVFDRGLGILYQQASLLRHVRDWDGLFVVWLNMAAAFLLLDQPVLALLYLAKLSQPEPGPNQQGHLHRSKSISSISSTSGTGTGRSSRIAHLMSEHAAQPPMPRKLRTRALFLLSQCVFVLSQINAAVSETSSASASASSSSLESLQRLAIPDAICGRLRQLLKRDLAIDIYIDFPAVTEDDALTLLRHCEEALLFVAQMRQTPSLYPILVQAVLSSQPQPQPQPQQQPQQQLPRRRASLATTNVSAGHSSASHSSSGRAQGNALGSTNAASLASVSSNSSISSSTATAASTLQSSPASTRPSRVDSLKHELVLVQLTTAKIAWIMGGGLYTKTPASAAAGIRQIWLDQAQQALQQVVSGAFVVRATGRGGMDLLLYGDRQSGGGAGGSGSVGGSGSKGVETTVYEMLNGIAADLLHAMGDHQDAQMGRAIELGRPLVNGYLCHSVFMAVADMIRYAGEMAGPASGSGSGGDERDDGRQAAMLRVLGVPDDTVAAMSTALTEASRTLTEFGIGVCGVCLGALIDGLRGTHTGPAGDIPSDASFALGMSGRTGSLATDDQTAVDSALYTVLFRYHERGEGLDAAAALQHSVVPCPHFA
ncbi:hypothetical protein BC831DRAFT_440923 [Entophlyctis helioformis]|nr:hypothetical protein BC831DRAFT_440923 [Entophlyctis helioformis]